MPISKESAFFEIIKRQHFKLTWFLWPQYYFETEFNSKFGWNLMHADIY